jgi:hypothetical protein
MLRRWRETEWGAIWGRRKQDNEPKPTNRWIGGSFEVGNILGVNILQEPPESIRNSNRSARSIPRLGGSTSYLPLTTDDREYVTAHEATSFYATSLHAPEAGGSILRPPLSAEEAGRKIQSDSGARPTLEIATPAIKSDSHIAVLGKQRERAVHYAESPTREAPSPVPPSEVLERSVSEIPDTSAEAMATQAPRRRVPWGEVVMRGGLSVLHIFICLLATR